MDLNLFGVDEESSFTPMWTSLPGFLLESTLRCPGGFLCGKSLQDLPACFFDFQHSIPAGGEVAGGKLEQLVAVDKALQHKPVLLAGLAGVPAFVFEYKDGIGERSNL